MSKATNPSEVYDGLIIDAEMLSSRGVGAIRTAFGIVGIFGVALGVILMVWPGATLMVLAGVTAIFFVIGGITRLAFGIFGRELSGSGRALNLILGLIVLIAGIVVIRNLQSSTEVLAVIVVIFIGIGWIIEGVLTLATASRAESKGFAYFGGIVGILAGIFVIAAPQLSVGFLVVFTGAMFVILGIVSLVRAFTFGKDSKVIDV
ncbi:HdeD family acid-resistance protein [Demequina aurantiaca]|uniref:HdeD family acid-resistance protein n=1 Tax=Demequina aurantiaca TaxID=676200 RepID=UPI003D34537E